MYDQKNDNDNVQVNGLFRQGVSGKPSGFNIFARTFLMQLSNPVSLPNAPAMRETIAWFII